jgi:hypothetical protein
MKRFTFPSSNSGMIAFLSSPPSSAHTCQDIARRHFTLGLPVGDLIFGIHQILSKPSSVASTQIL